MSAVSSAFSRLPFELARMRSSALRGIASPNSAVPPLRKQQRPPAGGIHPPGCCCPQHRAMSIGLQARGDPVFAVEASSIRFGPGALLELAAAASAALQSLHSTRRPGGAKIALFTDVNVRATPWFQEAEHRLRRSLPPRTELDVWDGIQAEPTLESLLASSQWLDQARADVIISIGGGSVIDSAKACSLLTSTPPPPPSPSPQQPPEAAFLTYFNAPVGGARWPVDTHGRAAKLRPHIACPTTAGTGSECTGIAIFNVEHMRVKAGIAHPHLRPSLAIIDPVTQTTTSPSICAATGFDVLSHAIESYTALSHADRRGTPSDPGERFAARPMSQGSNAWADSGCLTAMNLVSQNIVAACEGNMEARSRMMLASTMAGIAFGNVGVHLPHAMSYAVSGRMPREQAATDCASHLPHGMSVILCAPAAVAALAAQTPARHAAVAAALGCGDSSAAGSNVAASLKNTLVRLMRSTGMPSGLAAVGYCSADAAELASATMAQQRLLNNMPTPYEQRRIEHVFQEAMNYW